MNIVLPNIYFESPLGKDIVYWFADEQIKIENKRNFLFENFSKYNTTADEDEQKYRKIILCPLWEKGKISNKIVGHCH